jgi:hypothetical protein
LRLAWRRSTVDGVNVLGNQLNHLIAALAALAMLVAPAIADDKGLITMVNRSADIISGINSYQIEDGKIIDDNVGGFFEPLSPGQSVTFDLAGRCGLVQFYVRLRSRELSGDDDLQLTVNTCKQRTLVYAD